MTEQRPMVIDAEKFAALRGVVDGSHLDLADAARVLGVTRVDLAVEVAEYVLSSEYAQDFEAMIGELGLAPAEVLAATDRIECAEEFPGILRPQLIDTVGMQAFDPAVAVSSILRVRNPVGARVLARRPSEPFYYAGVMRAIVGDQVQVELDVRTQVQVSPTDLLPMNWAPGDVVMVRAERTATYATATIARVDDRMVEVQFANGKSGLVGTERVRLLPVGALILANSRDQCQYLRRVVSCESDGVVVAYEDGTAPATISLAGVRRLDAAIGDFLFTRADQGPFALPDQPAVGAAYDYFHPARVLARQGNRILCQLGPDQAWTPLSMICTLLPGTRVLALNLVERTLAPARVQRLEEQWLQVAYDAGGQANLTYREIDRLFLQVGENLTARKLGVGGFLPATIVKMDEEKALVRFLDGDQAWADLADLRFEIPLPANPTGQPATIEDVARSPEFSRLRKLMPGDTRPGRARNAAE